MQQRADEELASVYRESPQTGQWCLEELFSRYHSRVALWCYRLTGNRDWAADLAQEVFMKAFRNIDSFRGDARFSTWLYTIARNHCFNELKSRSARPDTAGDELPLDLAAPGEDVLATLQRKDAAEQLHQLLKEHLTDIETQVMTLHYAEELPLDAISRLLQLENASGAKAYIVSARRKLNRVIARLRSRQTKGGSKEIV